MTHPFEAPLTLSSLTRPALLFTLSSAVAGLGWWRGDSRWPALAFQLLSGFGYPALLTVLAMLLLSVMAIKCKGRLARFAYNDFYNLWRYAQATLTRIIAVFAGMIAVAAACWASTGSASAMQVVLYGTVLLAMVVYYLLGLSSMAAALALRGLPADLSAK
ncbi:hypothetical protein GQ37_019910 [Janthinobacterium sp. BJB1]|uniref:hypothetical protein n=1 Tax=Janthinobacterium sp. GW458P TaxID=1981504 RepID=UPI000A322C82|nr:hypothetical protein [Janthinobacterium sp. GW458P]MBE3027675.1 hypothetical protein [Janthinobacterium sp. GW458P]PHV15017.1 hypothetical protein CSQ90_20430 [Janthinobacterium sp. BJB303]PJC96924.1 hypothetical protein GQ37_019910 [Janthinobacterium sp. BJB1]